MIQDQEKDKITSLNKEVFHRLVDDQIKLESVEYRISEAETKLESHEKVYRIFRAIPLHFELCTFLAFLATNILL